MIIIVDSHIRIPVDDIQDENLKEIRDTYTYINPEWIQAQRTGFGKYTKKKYIENWLYTYSGLKQYLSIPRGGMVWLKKYLNEKDITHSFDDKRSHGHDFKVSLKNGVKLRELQQNGVNIMLKYQQGVLNYEPGVGKTVTALGFISETKKSTLIIVNSDRLAEQWILEINKYLDYGYPIGVIQSRKTNIQPITVAMVQTLNRWTDNDQRLLSNKFGALIYDEVHHAPADCNFKVLQNFGTKYRLGLTASKTRKDGLEFLIYDYFDRIRQYEKGTTLSPQVFHVNTGFRANLNDFNGRWNLIEDLIAGDRDRTNFIVEQVIEDVKDGHSVLLLANRNSLAQKFCDILNSRGIKAIAFLGTKKEMCFNELRTKITSKEIQVVTSCKVFDEGLDIPALSCLHLAGYQAAKEPLRQRIGRIRRLMAGKKEPIVKYYIDEIEQCYRTAKKHIKWYKEFDCNYVGKW